MMLHWLHLLLAVSQRIQVTRLCTHIAFNLEQIVNQALLRVYISYQSFFWEIRYFVVVNFLLRHAIVYFKADLLFLAALSRAFIQVIDGLQARSVFIWLFEARCLINIVDEIIQTCVLDLWLQTPVITRDLWVSRWADQSQVVWMGVYVFDLLFVWLSKCVHGILLLEITLMDFSVCRQ